jgi:hypothetical protein
MALEPQSQRVVDFIAKLGLPDLSETTPEEARRLSALRMENLPPGPDAKVVSFTIPGAEDERSVRVYRPLDAGEELLGCSKPASRRRSPATPARSTVSS